MLFLLILTSIFCVAPIFIQLNISDHPLRTILSIIPAIPAYYIFSQVFHTILLWSTAFLFRRRIIYSYFIIITKLSRKFYIRAFLNQVMGFAPGIAFQYREERLNRSFFKLYYILFMGIYRNLFLLPLIPFSIVTAIIQRLYEPEYQQLFLLKSKVSTILESECDYRFSIKDYPKIWKRSSKSELPFIALSYISLIKNYLSEEQCKEIEVLEDDRLADRSYQMGLYGMLDVIKLNSYFYKDNMQLSLRYKKMLNQLLEGKSYYIFIRDDIDGSFEGRKALSLSFGISEISLFIDVYK